MRIFAEVPGEPIKMWPQKDCATLLAELIRDHAGCARVQRLRKRASRRTVTSAPVTKRNNGPKHMNESGPMKWRPGTEDSKLIVRVGARSVRWMRSEISGSRNLRRDTSTS